ncbi:MAG: PqqD family protein [Herbiconiux sp.]|nr:PqqD family protein [Herbiconiux sp.]
MTHDIPADARIWRTGERVAISVGTDSVTVLDLDDRAGVPVTLTGTAFTIWAAVDGRSTTEQIVRSTAESYEMPEAEVQPEVVRFLESLRAAGLLVAD